MADLSRLTDYSWADIAKAAKVAMVNAALGGANYVINGQNFGRISIDEAKKLFDLATEMQAEASDSGNGIGLAAYGERI